MQNGELFRSMTCEFCGGKKLKKIRKGEYVCEYCGHVLFHGIDEVEEWLRKCHAMFGKEKADGDQT